jgi:signal transduction histidine kinase
MGAERRRDSLKDSPSMSMNSYKLLVVDDDEGDRKQIDRAIRQSGIRAESTETASLEEGLAACERSDFDCAIIDYQLPGEDGLDGITALHERFPDMAIIMSTGQGDEMVATEAMKRGAADYISKSRLNPSTLQRTIGNAFEKTALQRRIRQQQEELENFARVLAHDLRAPAAAIETLASRIAERLQEGNFAEALEYADGVIERAHRMNRLIDTLHRYTQADASVAFETVDMNRVFDEACANLQYLIQECGASVTAETLPSVFGNAPQLIQLLQNLIGNGLKYCDRPIACIHLSASQPVAPEGNRNPWLFAVADNGIGISEEHHTKIFKPFIRLKGASKRDGTGLGLATCKKIVERHHGTIWCESRLGSGTTFFFTLPGEDPQG